MSPMVPLSLKPCRLCGHTRESHVHYRRGNDCAVCVCPGYRRRWPWNGARTEAYLPRASSRFVTYEQWAQLQEGDVA